MRLRSQGPSVVVDAPAKLNLFLEVLGRRPDGFHELETVMVSIGLYDSLRFSAAAEGEIRLQTRVAVRALPGESPAALGPEDDNLVVRAARLLRERCGVSTGASIELVKRIPWQAGLGGGSSDAAATLVALNRFWNLQLSREELHRLAAELGSDVNFFVDSSPLAVCRGRGEHVESRRLARGLTFVVAQPAGGLATRDVFRRWSAGGNVRGSGELLTGLGQSEADVAASGFYNALEGPATSLHEGVRRLLALLRREAGDAVGLSGSGSACFAWCRSRRRAEVIARQLRAAERCRALVAASRT
jgi:4-diphosphocytidyl-2-C-methyl-D-erythritol kinase